MVKLHRHQEEALSRLRNGCILWGGVGTGKSITAAAYYCRNEAPRDVYVITTAKKRDSLDWEVEFAKFGVAKLAHLPVAGSLTVDSWHNLHRYRNVTGAFFIFDEQRVVGSGGWVRDFIKLSRGNNWILLSATPGGTWVDYIPVFVANGFYRNRSEFSQEHIEYEPYVKFPKIRRFHNVGRLVKLRRQILVEMPYIGRTTRTHHMIDVSHDEETLKKVITKRWNVFEERPLTGVADLFSVMRKVVNSSPTRSAVIRSLMKKHPKLIVFYNFDYELDILRCLVSGHTMKETDGSDPSSPALSGISSDRMDLSKESEEWQTQTPADTTSSTPHSTNEASQLLFAAVAEPILGEESPTQNIMTTSPQQVEIEKSGSIMHQGSEVWQTATTPSSARVSSSPLTDQQSTTPTASVADPTFALDTKSQTIIGTTSTTTDGSESPLRIGKQLRKTSSKLFGKESEEWNVSTWSSESQFQKAADTRSATASTAQGTSEEGPRTDTSTTSTRTSGTTTVRKDGLLSKHVIAEWNGHKHQPIPDSDRWVYLVQYQAGAEGWNCIETDAMVFYSLPYSYKAWHQAHGRIDRINTPFHRLYYYTLKSMAFIDNSIWKCLGEKRDFNESAVVKELRQTGAS